MADLSPKMLAALAAASRSTLRRVRRGWLPHNTPTRSGAYHLPETISALQRRGLIAVQFDRATITRSGRAAVMEADHG